jgi:thiol-disulfide isomerase/thioredoxin
MRIVFATLLLLGLPLTTHAKASGAPPRSATAPHFVLPTRDGSVALDSLRAKVVLIDFWASWCEPCRRSFPWLESMHERYSGKGLAIVAINLDKTRDPAFAFLEKYPARFTVAFDPDGKTAEAFKVKGMPSSFVLGPTGAILHAHSGFDPKKTGAIETLIQEACSR